MIQKVEQAITHVPSPQTVAYLKLRDEDYTCMLFTLRLPFPMDEAKVALRIAEVTGDQHSLLLCRFFKQRPIILLNRTTEDSYKVAQTLVCEIVGSHRLKSVLRHLTSVPISCGLI